MGTLTHKSASLSLLGAVAGGSLGAFFDASLNAIFIESMSFSDFGAHLIGGAMVGLTIGLLSLIVFLSATWSMRGDSEGAALGLVRVTLFWGCILVLAIIEKSMKGTPVVTVELFLDVSRVVLVFTGVSLGQYAALMVRRTPEKA
ncbi:MAG: hypothetical protein K2Y39_09735 [Candidatus Obscuribacterales bacterium]|nr:hypothetical protein [Candidatus Obscuribacterales bacterium]